MEESFLKRFSSVHEFYKTEYSAIFLIDDKYVLKLHAPSTDVQEIAGIMALARRLIPVPKVYECGYSGNSSYILMERIEGWSLDAFIMKAGRQLSTHPKVVYQIERVVRRLARVGISHNDLYPRNVMFDKDLIIVGVIDWDAAAPLHASNEYLRRTRYKREPWVHDWDYIFLRHCPEKLEHYTEDLDKVPFPCHVVKSREPWAGFYRPDHWLREGFVRSDTEPTAGTRYL